MTVDVPGRSRRLPIVLIAVAAVLVIAAAVTIIILTNDQDDDGLPVAGPGTCADNRGRPQVLAYFDGPDADANMEAAAGSLRADKQVAAVGTETRQRAFERFKEIFKDQPELLKLARPEALPASVYVLPIRGIRPEDLANRMRTQFPTAGKITPDACRVTATSGPQSS